ncbi:MAG TPA: glycosyltransferase family 2 protein [Chthoniobacterales bacterium]|jgi:undecaprenyl-phosphate 4-deoxy-4-formamido-L-arabinose transferase
MKQSLTFPDPCSLSIVIAVFNGARSIPELCRRLTEVLATRAAPFEIILVNDCSRDHSWEVIEQLAADGPGVRGINFMRNYGQHNALLCGIRAARYAAIVTMDDDLQHAPEEIPGLLERLNEGFDVVYGTPESERNGFLRGIASYVTRLALRAAVGADVAKNVSAFRVFRTQLRDAFRNYQAPFVSIDVLLTWGTTRFAAKKVPFQSRSYGASNYTFGKLVRHALDMMTGFSTAPLQLASLIGFACTLFGLGVFVYVVGCYFAQGSIPGFPFLASIIAIFCGAELFALGVMGEYLARMHFRTMDRPVYTVRNGSGESELPEQ